MAECMVRNWDGQEVSQATLELKTAKEENAAHIIHRALVRQATNSRQGNACSKTRSEVSGGGRKPWRQKGTGRARAGSIRSPLWRGGGVIFGPKPRDFEVKMNRKERRLAIQTALQSRCEELIVVEDFGDRFPRPKTKELVEAFKRWGIDTDSSRVLAILGQPEENVTLSARNIACLKVIYASNLNIYDLLAADRIVVTASALASIQEMYGND
ncbi:MAG: 50S ribosomal protein L4 [Coleofasciculaceae cyanobacterium SM2_3_26]|nr:50S ribosomal protein L4 [Coleofasciculaceae cyanobacterium SM2_3_26]